MGAVYAVRDLASDREVALKIIARNHTSDPTMVARFQREGRLVSTIRHRNIVEVLELGQLDGEWFISMELLDGMNLADAIAAKTTFEIAETVLRAVRGPGRALKIAHDNRIIHRDVKPQNIFLSRSADGASAVKVLDFGVAKVVGLSGQEQLTRSGTILGTPEFMAPEQATGTKVDHRSDLYAVGCVAYAMLCGRPPFLDNWPMRILMKQAFEAHLPPSRLRPALARAPAVDPFIARAMDKNPAARYQSATEMRTAVEALAAAPP